MMNYYHSYLPRLATATEPLHRLLRKETEWNWDKDCASSFASVKELLCSAPLLTHFDPTLPIVVHCDASPYGLGAILSHLMSDGTEKPVSYASRTLSVAERNYAHIEKEGLALVFAVKKFHQFLFGHRFLLYTDHKPILGLFAENRELPTRAASRVLRWALLLAAYDYELKYRPGSSNGNADGLSRLPVDARSGDISQTVVSVNLMELVSSPVTEKEVRAATRTDAELGVVLNRTLEEWNGPVSPQLKPYSLRADELTTEGGVLLWGSRVIIPKVLRHKVLAELHEVHPGVSRMKSLARSYVWWPGIGGEIEELVRHCDTCQKNHRKPTSAPVHPWERPSSPWERLHIDHAQLMVTCF